MMTQAYTFPMEKPQELDEPDKTYEGEWHMIYQVVVNGKPIDYIEAENIKKARLKAKGKIKMDNEWDTVIIYYPTDEDLLTLTQIHKSEIANRFKQKIESTYKIERASKLARTLITNLNKNRKRKRQR